MTDAKRNNKLDDSVVLKRIKPRYININEDILYSLTPSTLKLYMVFRFESDYSIECSSLKRKIKFFENKSGLSRSQCFVCIKELEKNGLLKRVKDEGYQSTYWIAHELNYFLPKKIHPPVQNLDGVVQNLDGVVQNLDHISNNSFTNLSQKNISTSGEVPNVDNFDQSSRTTQNLKEESKRRINKGDSHESPNLSYNVLERDENKKSDYLNNYDSGVGSGAEALEGEAQELKSDYFENQSKNRSHSKSKIHFGLECLLKDNPWQIPEQVLKDWITTRKTKRAPVTATTWARVNKELAKCKEQGIEPIEAFEIMVASGWQSMKLEYFLTKEIQAKNEIAKKRSIELEQLAIKNKQKEIEDSKRLNQITSKVSEDARKDMRKILGITNQVSASSRC